MYGNPYYNPQMNIDRINNQIKELENMRNQYQNIPQQNTVPTNLTQNFQISPNSGVQNGIKYVSSTDDVKKELVFTDTLFVNKEYTTLWLKNVQGEVKTYGLKEIIELDEKDQKIAELMAKITLLESEKENYAKQSYTSNDDETNAIKKSTRISESKSSNK